MNTKRGYIFATLTVALWTLYLALSPLSVHASKQGDGKNNVESLEQDAEILPNGAEGDSDAKIGRNMEILIDAFRSLQTFYVDTIDSDVMLKDALYGMTLRLDPYTSFLSEEDVGNFEMMTTGKYGGIGSLIRQKGEYVYIAGPYKDSPADRAGVEIGDKIVAIDGVSAQGVGSAAVSSQLKGDPGSVVLLTLEKFYGAEHKVYEIERQRIAIPSIPYYGFVGDSIGYIAHTDFTQSCSEDMRDAVMRLKDSGRLKGLILDYRNNSGGVLQEAVKILSLFVPKGTEVVEMRGKKTETSRVFMTESEPIALTIPIVVLVNTNSASATEIVAGALQDLDRAVLVGQRSFGKGLVQSTRPLGYSTFLKITTAKYYLPSQRCIQAIDYSPYDQMDGEQRQGRDSLGREFFTKGGRKVYDGGGVMPDLELAPEYVSRFMIALYTGGYIDDFSDIYARKHRGVATDPTSFALSDADYESFIEFMADKKLNYQSETAIALKRVKEMAEKELYLKGISGDIERIEESLKDDKNSNLKLYKEMISSLIEDNIVLRDHYDSGVRKRNLINDPEVKRATELLNTPGEYGAIIAPLAK